MYHWKAIGKPLKMHLQRHMACLIWEKRVHMASQNLAALVNEKIDWGIERK
jgi:hypothetical protein